jgi:hypothetical protein
LVSRVALDRLRASHVDHSLLRKYFVFKRATCMPVKIILAHPATCVGTLFVEAKTVRSRDTIGTTPDRKTPSLRSQHDIDEALLVDHTASDIERPMSATSRHGRSAVQSVDVVARRSKYGALGSRTLSKVFSHVGIAYANRATAVCGRAVTCLPFGAQCRCRVLRET